MCLWCFLGVGPLSTTWRRIWQQFEGHSVYFHPVGLSYLRLLNPWWDPLCSCSVMLHFMIAIVIFFNWISKLWPISFVTGDSCILNYDLRWVSLTKLCLQKQWGWILLYQHLVPFQGLSQHATAKYHKTLKFRQVLIDKFKSDIVKTISRKKSVLKQFTWKFRHVEN